MRAGALAAAMAIACSAAPRAVAPACPAGHGPSAERTQRLTELLARDAESTGLLAHARELHWCYAPNAAGVLAGDALLLDERASDRSLAARAAHLLHHRASGVARSSGHPEDALEIEARALEARWLERNE